MLQPSVCRVTAKQNLVNHVMNYSEVSLFQTWPFIFYAAAYILAEVLILDPEQLADFLGNLSINVLADSWAKQSNRRPLKFWINFIFLIFPHWRDLVAHFDWPPPLCKLLIKKELRVKRYGESICLTFIDSSILQHEKNTEWDTFW